MSGESAWTRTVVAAMLSVMGLGTLVLGALGVVAVASNGGKSESGTGTQVEVHLTEFAVEMVPPAIPPGDVTLIVHNDGTVEHNFSIPSLALRTANLKPGETETLAVKDLGEGELQVI